MNYIKARFLKGDKPAGRAYTYRIADEVKPGDMVTDAKGSKLMVMDEPVDMEWVEAYGPDKVAVVRKYTEEYGEVETVNILNCFIGKSFSKVENIGDEELIFQLGGTKYVFYHEQSCCENVTIEDVCGNLVDLENSPITMAEEVCHERVGDYVGDGRTYTFYKFATVKGYVTVRWCGSSNGYYSESVDFKVIRA